MSQEPDGVSASPPFGDSRPTVESERAELLLRLSELDRQLKRRRRNAIEGSEEELHACRVGIAELHRQLDAIHASESWRVGNGITRAVLTVGRPVRVPYTRVRRVWRARASNRGRVYRLATSAGSPLATLDGSRAALSTDEDQLEPLDAVVDAFRRARADGPRQLEQAEIDALRRALAVTGEAHELASLARAVLDLREAPERETASNGRGGSIVVDVRALQIPIECGTKTHAEHVVRALRSSVPRRTRVLMLRAPALPDLPPRLAELFDGRFVPGATPLDDVSAFLQLMAFAPVDDRIDFELLRAPGVRRATVWLDAIMGSHPDTFLPNNDSFLEYQLGVERLGCADHVLALSSSGRDELPQNLRPATRVVVSSSRPGLSPADLPAAHIGLPAGRYCVVLGNGLPHKNLAAGASAFAGSRRARRQGMSLIVVAAAMDEDQRVAVTRLVAASGGDPTTVAFYQDLTRGDLAAVLDGAAAVLVPSFHEGFSLPVVEAIGLGTPVVASDIPAHRELLGPDPALIDPADPVGMGTALDQVFAAPGETLARQRRALDERFDSSLLDRVVLELVGSLVPRSRQHEGPVTTHRAATDTPASRTSTSSDTGSGLSQSKVCNLEDFSHPELLDDLRRHFAHEVARFGPAFPTGREWRKYWEVAMAMRTFRHAGLLNGQHEVLGVGAGNEPTIFLLTQYASRVVATDLYLDSEWEETANASMLTDPGSHWPFSWNPTRLQVAHMDARDLRFPDETFDGVFSSSSIEHFGDRDEIGRALDEIYRVLTPGGIVSISSEYKIGGPGRGFPGVELFTSGDVHELFLADRGWTLVDDFDEEISAATLATIQDFDTAAGDQARQIRELGGYWTHLIEFSSYPHIVLSRPPYRFTSFHLALRKHD